MLQHCKYHVKVLLKWLHLNGHTVMFPPYSKVKTTVRYQKRRFSKAEVYETSTLVPQKWRPLKTAFYRISVNGKTKVFQNKKCGQELRVDHGVYGIEFEHKICSALYPYK